ncbi:MAG: ABC transporter permease [Deltaproteobacteria bacterium]|nr:ABC transporter permease [Deltaproteobacteria bacterium]
MKKTKAQHYIKFIVYLVVIVLVNVAGLTLFFRADLTKNHIYSLSAASKEAVATLSEPLTVDVFFTKKLPAPYNGTRRYLQDLLEEYDVYAKKPYFNYRFYDVSAKDERIEKSAGNNRELAESYGITPVQVRTLEQDEMKFKNAYMGLVLIHGDLVEKIQSITTTEGLEYKLTSAIEKLNNKISRLVSLSGKVHVNLVMSSSLKKVAPAMGLHELPALAGKIKDVVEKLNARNYGKLEFKNLDPDSEKTARDLVEKYRIMTLKWPALPGQGVNPGDGSIGLVVSYGDDARMLQLLNVFRIPLFGTQYKLVAMDKLEDLINGAVETVIGINENIGYLADHGTINLFSPMPGGDQSETLSNFYALVSKDYTVKEMRLSGDGIDKNINCLVIAHPTEKFSDYDLYQIDQALMRGTNIAIFSDAFKEEKQQNPGRFNMGPSYKELDTGLEKLLAHYGVKIKKSYILDKSCYKQQLSSRGGGGERPIYFAPIIKNEKIDHSLAFMKNIKGIVTLNNSPVVMDNDVLKKDKLEGRVIFSSSDESWEMKGRISLNPLFIRPPEAKDQFSSKPLAVLVEGEFPSYFAGKQIPEKPDVQKDAGKKADDTKDAKNTDKAKDKIDLSSVKSENAFISLGKKAKLAVIGSYSLLKDNMIDAQGATPNAMLVLNLIDSLNGRGDIASMRSKSQQFNPLNKTDPATKNLVKLADIAGLPVLVVLVGLLVWWRRRARKKRIRMMFEG